MFFRVKQTVNSDQSSLLKKYPFHLTVEVDLCDFSGNLFLPALCVEGQFEGEQVLIYGLQVKCSIYKELFSPCGIEMLSSF